ncbi:hypothetical protein LTR56_027682 [Elasticomyces elasticus]|nr:hypothetical protein LTR56_027682 [Elasticomyces elasticus]KAK5732422.1 hypothetical protein LTS12_027127 [Elasticomyces elasticus]
MSVTRNDKPWWDFKELFHTGAARYRLYMVIVISFFAQWSGNNVISYFMPKMIEAAGITSSSTHLLINAINRIFSLIAAVYGATLFDKLGRRVMLMAGLVGALGSYVLLTAFTATSSSNSDMAYGNIVSIYLFGILFAWDWTPLQNLYAVECLENRTRGISVGIAKIGWNLYLMYIVWICVEFVIVYFFFVETKGKTLEELSEVFEAPNPRKASTKKVKVVDRVWLCFAGIDRLLMGQ